MRLFARAKDLAGTDCLELELSAPLTVGDVRRALLKQLPALGPLAHSLLAAVDAEYANDDHPVVSRGEVAFFPPVSGG